MNHCQALLLITHHWDLYTPFDHESERVRHPLPSPPHPQDNGVLLLAYLILLCWWYPVVAHSWGAWRPWFSIFYQTERLISLRDAETLFPGVSTDVWLASGAPRLRFLGYEGRQNAWLASGTPRLCFLGYEGRQNVWLASGAPRLCFLGYEERHSIWIASGTPRL